MTSFEIPPDLSAGDTLELSFTVNNNQGGTPAAVTLTADFDPDQFTTLDAFASALAEQVSNAQHPDASLADRALGLSADIVTLSDPASGASGGGPLGIQVSAPQGANLSGGRLSLSTEVAVDEGSVTQQISEARIAIPSDVGDLSQSAQLDVLIAGPGFPVDAEGNPGIDFEFNIFPGQTPQSIADQLRNEIVSRLGEAAQETVDVRIETGEGGELSLVLQSSAGAITTDIDFESIIQGQPGTQNINTVALPDQLDPGETLELTLTVNTPTGGGRDPDGDARDCHGDARRRQRLRHSRRHRGPA